MLKRAFTYFLLLHLLSAFGVFSLTDHSKSANAPVQPAKSMQALTYRAEIDPLLNFFGDLFSGIQHQDSEEQRNSFSDFFRIRKYSYRFWGWDAFVSGNTTSLSTLSFLFAKPQDTSLFDSVLSLPAYYHFLFRLTPF